MGIGCTSIYLMYMFLLVPAKCLFCVGLVLCINILIKHLPLLLRQVPVIYIFLGSEMLKSLSSIAGDFNYSLSILWLIEEASAWAGSPLGRPFFRAVLVFHLALFS